MKSQTPIKSTQRRAIIWGRFSSDQQKDGDSEGRQSRLNRAVAKREGIQIIGEHFDPAMSVKDGLTPLFKKVIADLPAGVGIISENLDRINRTHPWLQKAYIHKIVTDGHFIITSQDGTEYNKENINDIGTLATGDLQTNLSNAENIKRTKRVREAKANAVELARQGKPAPFGKWLPAHIKYNPETKQYDIREDRRQVLEKIFRDYSNGKGVCAITKELNLNGTPTFRGKGIIGGWQRTTVFTLLRYEGVIGVFNYKGERIENAWKPAITEKLFYKVQSILEVNKTKHGNHASLNVNSILRGVAKCSHCGSTMKVTTDGYLACYGHQIAKCKIKNMLRDYKEIEWAFINWFVDAAKDTLLGKDEKSVSIEALIAKKNAMNERIDVTLNLLDDDKQQMPVDKIKARLAKLETEKVNVDNEIATAKSNQANTATLPEAFEQLQSYVDGVMMDNQDIRRKISSIVPTIVKRVEVDISDKSFPSFEVELINGMKEKWTYDIGEFAIDTKGKFHVIEGGYVDNETMKKQVAKHAKLDAF